MTKYESTTYMCDDCGQEESIELGLDPRDWTTDDEGADFCPDCSLNRTSEARDAAAAEVADWED